MNLDNLHDISQLDTEKMFEMVYTWPNFVENITAQTISIPSNITIGKNNLNYQNRISQIVITGMGGSAVSGDYIRTILENSIEYPIIVQRNYTLPRFVNENTLIIVISYSGNTEESISGLISAIENNCPTICIGSGGKLGEFCTKNQVPFFKIPSGYQPRASFPLLFFPILKILDSVNLVPLNSQEVQEVIDQLKTMRDTVKPEIPLIKNEAKKIAVKLHNKIPIIWSPFLCVANRFKCQINENSKQLALAEELPEFNHNHIVGFEGLLSENPFIIVIFQFPLQHPNVSLRFEITKEIIEEKVEVVNIFTKEGSLLTQLIISTYLGDYISIYLALLNKQNPSTVDSIDYLKSQMEKRGKTQSTLMKRLDSFS
ncbi:MAG: bifunctional phosphoglucose/phosphomannose isomerase [Candidatus Heimdallarchaeaceae archaeon]|jgi:glucose/mannose-6-phosphate isomerase